MIEGVFTAGKSKKSNLHNILQECIAKKNLGLGRVVHSILISCGYECKDNFSGQIIRLYITFGHWQEAKSTFSRSPRPNLYSWSAMVAGYARIGDAPKVLELYEKMVQSGVEPNNEVFLCMLKVCCSQGLIGVLDAMEVLESQAIPLSNNILIGLLQGCLKTRSLAACRHLLEVMKCKNLHSFTLFGNQLIQAFTFCGNLQEANHVFEMIANPSTYTWNAIIVAHIHLGESVRAVNMFSRMQQEGTQPNEFIFTCTLKACGAIEEIELGRVIHHQIVVCQLESNTSIGNALLDLYSKGLDVRDASTVFNNLAHPDIVSWGSMAVCFSHHGHDLAVVKVYKRMKEVGLTPNRAVFLHVIKACGNIGALGHGRLVHADILRNGLQTESFVGSVLIQMYASCGDIEDLQTFFKGIHAHDVIDWGAMIRGLVHQGDYQSAAEYLEYMLQEGLKPDAVIFTAILTACTHAGLLDEGIQQIKVMIEKCGIAPSITHYNSLIDLHARMGLLEEAKDLLFSKPGSLDIIGWKSILSGCRMHSTNNLGFQCLDACVQIDPHDSASYILMSNILADIDL